MYEHPNRSAISLNDPPVPGMASRIRSFVIERLLPLVGIFGDRLDLILFSDPLALWVCADKCFLFLPIVLEVSS